MVSELERLVSDWKTLRQHGKGYIEICQVSQGSFGEWYHPFGIYDTWQRIEDHIISHFRLEMNYSKYRTPRYIIEGDSQLFVELMKLKKDKGRLLSYGFTTRDQSGRRGPHYLVVEGGYEILRKTFEYLKRNPKGIREFVKVVFEWQNASSYKQVPPNDKEWSYTGSLGRQLDLFDEVKRVHFLDVGTGYNPIKRGIIRWRKHNPDVRTINVT